MDQYSLSLINSPEFFSHFSVHGGWSSWIETVPCSVSCGGGTKVLVRECNEPVPAHGGNDCDGKPYTVKPCNSCPCEPRDMAYSYITIATITMLQFT